MSRRTSLERAIAIGGIIAWALLLILGVRDHQWIWVTIMSFALVLAASEYRRWTDDPSKPPRIAWFGFGAFIGQIVLIFPLVLYAAASGEAVERDLVKVLAAVGWLGGGLGVRIGLIRAAERREALSRPVPVPPPPVPVETTPSNSMKVRCASCGAWVGYDALTCPTCGRPARAPVT